MPLVVVLDEADIVRKVANRILTGLNFEVFATASADEAIARCIQQLPEYVIIDSSLEGADDVITDLRAMPGGGAVRVFYCVVEADMKTMVASMRAGADDILLKPFDRAALVKKFAPDATAA